MFGEIQATNTASITTDIPGSPSLSLYPSLHLSLSPPFLPLFLFLLLPFLSLFLLLPFLCSHKKNIALVYPGKSFPISALLLDVFNQTVETESPTISLSISNSTSTVKTAVALGNLGRVSYPINLYLFFIVITYYWSFLIIKRAGKADEEYNITVQTTLGIVRATIKL